MGKVKKFCAYQSEKDKVKVNFFLFFYFFYFFYFFTYLILVYTNIILSSSSIFLHDPIILPFNPRVESSYH